MQASTRPIARPAFASLFAVLVPFPVAGFAGGLLTDLAYWRTAEMMWSDFSAWLISAGVIMGFLAALAGLIDFLANGPAQSRGTAWRHAVVIVVMLALATVNMFVHTRDAWTSVVPWGLALSAATIIVLLFSGWMGWSMVARQNRTGALS